MDEYELKRLLEEMGEKPTHDELTKMINDVNPNDNKGYLTFKDWTKIMSMCLENADNTE